jgi:hypothetical protein
VLSSPFQQPSRRQNALALQIQEARTTSDEVLLLRLISQWVHRYGFNSAGDLDLILPEPTVSDREFSPIAVDASVAPAFEPLPMSVAEEPSFASETVAEEELVIEEEVTVDEEVVAEEEDVAEEEELVDRTALKQSFTAAPVPAPPITTPRSLRRWLPRREDDDFQKVA